MCVSLPCLPRLLVVSDPSSRRAPRGLFWWVATIATLVVVDDLTYGPISWLLVKFFGQAVIALVFVIYFVAQLYLVNQGIRDSPTRLAGALLDRLQLSRRSSQVADRETHIHEHVTGAALACVFSLLIGGVLPPLLLWRRGWSRTAVQRVAVATSAIYAAEFAMLHGWIPSQIF